MNDSGVSNPKAIRGCLALLVFAGVLQGCALVGGPAQGSPGARGGSAGRPGAGSERVPAAASSEAWTEVGVASWYGKPFHGRATASGETFDMNARTGAHPTLPFGTRLRVENLDNGRSAVLTVNDRGPFVDDRILDVSRKVAEELRMVGPGTARVRITVLEWGAGSGAVTVLEGGAGSEEAAVLEGGAGLEGTKTSG